MGNQIIITKWEDRVVTLTMEEGRMVQADVDSPNKKSILGNIYVGKVKNIIRNIEAAFVEIEAGILCYMSLAQKGEPIFVNTKNNNAITAGDEIIVQVTKEDVKSKQPVVSFNLNLTGKYVVLVKGKEHVLFSSKIKDVDIRERLLALLGEQCEGGYGFIVRTNGFHASESQLMNEVRMLKDWYRILQKEGVHKSCFSLLHQAPASYLCNIRDAYEEELERFLTNEENIYLEVKGYLEKYQKEDLPKLHFYQDENVSLNALFNLRSQFEEAFYRKVWLKSGGNIIIDYTEACTVIDVNTEKAIHGKKRLAIYRKVNWEAAKEIAYQLRLRNISGIVLVDFIDMDSKKEQEDLIRYFKDLVEKDPIRTVLVDMTKLGLVELTRKKIRKPLYEQWKN